MTGGSGRMSTQHRQKVVVIGGGYAGALAAVRVAGRARRGAEVTLVEPRGELVQRLRLHQAAAGRPIRGHDLRTLTGPRVANVRGHAEEIDVAAGVVRTSGHDGRRALPFDYVIVATGSTVDTASVPGVAEHGCSLADPGAAARLALTLRHLGDGDVVAVCGGGLTGIEAASEFAEARPGLRVTLVTAGRVDDWLSPRGKAKLRARLGELGVEIVEHTRIQAVDCGRLELAGGGIIEADAAVWCGGFVGRSLARDSGLATDDRGRLLVDGTLRSVTHPRVLGAGDAAAIPALPNGAAFRMSCQAGMPAGAHAADAVARMIEGREPEPFDFGYIAKSVSLGRRDAIVQWLDRTDRPRHNVLTGRPAVVVKELATRAAVRSIAIERRMPGATRWLSGGAPDGASVPLSEAAPARP